MPSRAFEGDQEEVCLLRGGGVGMAEFVREKR